MSVLKQISPHRSHSRPFEHRMKYKLEMPQSANNIITDFDRGNKTIEGVKRINDPQIFYFNQIGKLLNYSNQLTEHINNIEPKLKINKKIMCLKLKQYDESVKSLYQQTLVAKKSNIATILPPQFHKKSITPMRIRDDKPAQMLNNICEKQKRNRSFTTYKPTVSDRHSKSHLVTNFKNKSLKRNLYKALMCSDNEEKKKVVFVEDTKTYKKNYENKEKCLDIKQKISSAHKVLC